MLADEFPVNVDIGHEARRAETYEDTLPTVFPRDVESLPVPSGTSVISSTILAVKIVPGMGEVNRLPSRVVEIGPGCAFHITLDEFPIAVKRNFNAG